MDIAISVEHGGRPDILLTLNPEDIFGTSAGDQSYLRVQATLKRGNTWNKPPLRGNLPILVAFYGQLGSGIMDDGTGAMLAPLERLPINLATEENYEQQINLIFTCSRRYIQHLEEERAQRSQSKKMFFTLRLWGVVALVAPKPETLDTAATQPIQPPYFASGVHGELHIEVVGLKSVQIRSNERLEMSLSHWEDILPSLGYPRRAIFELPTLDVPTMPEELRAAADHLNTAHQLFLQEKYGAAVQHCRQARDALLVPNKKTWCQDHLGGVMGAEKAAMLDEAIGALNHLGHAASHGDSKVEIDRESAEYVVGTMTLILHYIGRKLQ